MEVIMSGLNIFIVGTIVIVLFICGIWLTFYEFKDIEEDQTNRRKHIEEDVKKDRS